nr:MAG: polyprotein 1 [Picornavirales sp.]
MSTTFKINGRWRLTQASFNLLVRNLTPLDNNQDDKCYSLVNSMKIKKLTSFLLDLTRYGIEPNPGPLKRCERGKYDTTPPSTVCTAPPSIKVEYLSVKKKKKVDRSMVSYFPLPVAHGKRPYLLKKNRKDRVNYKRNVDNGDVSPAYEETHPFKKDLTRYGIERNPGPVWPSLPELSSFLSIPSIHHRIELPASVEQELPNLVTAIGKMADKTEVTVNHVTFFDRVLDTIKQVSVTVYDIIMSLITPDGTVLDVLRVLGLVAIGNFIADCFEKGLKKTFVQAVTFLISAKFAQLSLISAFELRGDMYDNHFGITFQADNDYVSAIVNSVSLVLATKYSAEEGKDSKYTTYMNTLRNISSNVTFYGQAIFSLFEHTVNFFSKVTGIRLIDDALHADHDFQAFILELDRVVTLPNISDVCTGLIKLLETMGAVEYKIPPNSRLAYNQLVNKINGYLSNIRSSMNTLQRSPFMVNLAGCPGVGKSHISHLIAKVLAHYIHVDNNEGDFDDIPPDSLIYDLSSTAAYAPLYRGQVIGFINDLFQFTDTGALSPAASAYFDASAGDPVVLQGSEAHEKNMKILCKAWICCTNLVGSALADKVAKLMNMLDPEALKRRLRKSYMVVPKEEYSLNAHVEPWERQIDLPKATRARKECAEYSPDLTSEIISLSDITSDNPVVEYTFSSVEEFILHLREELRIHKDNVETKSAGSTGYLRQVLGLPLEVAPSRRFINSFRELYPDVVFPANHLCDHPECIVKVGSFDSYDCKRLDPENWQRYVQTGYRPGLTSKIKQFVVNTFSHSISARSVLAVLGVVCTGGLILWKLAQPEKFSCDLNSTGKARRPRHHKGGSHLKAKATEGEPSQSDNVISSTLQSGAEEPDIMFQAFGSNYFFIEYKREGYFRNCGSAIVSGKCLVAPYHVICTMLGEATNSDDTPRDVAGDFYFHDMNGKVKYIVPCTNLVPDKIVEWGGNTGEGSDLGCIADFMSVRVKTLKRSKFLTSENLTKVRSATSAVLRRTGRTICEVSAQFKRVTKPMIGSSTFFPGGEPLYIDDYYMAYNASNSWFTAAGDSGSPLFYRTEGTVKLIAMLSGSGDRSKSPCSLFSAISEEVYVFLMRSAKEIEFIESAEPKSDAVMKDKIVASLDGAVFVGPSGLVTTHFKADTLTDERDEEFEVAKATNDQPTVKFLSGEAKHEDFVDFHSGGSGFYRVRNNGFQIPESSNAILAARIEEEIKYADVVPDMRLLNECRKVLCEEIRVTFASMNLPTSKIDEVTGERIPLDDNEVKKRIPLTTSPAEFRNMSKTLRKSSTRVRLFGDQLDEEGNFSPVENAPDWPLFVEVLNPLKEQLADGVLDMSHVSNCQYATLKVDEARSLKEVSPGNYEAKKARTIVSGSLCHLFLSAAYIGTLFDSFITGQYVANVLYINPYLNQFQFVEHLRFKTQCDAEELRGFCFDVMSYDLEVPYEFLWAASELIISLTGYQGAHKTTLVSLLRYFCLNIRGYPVKENDKYARTDFYSSDKGIPSGHYCTNLIGSLATVLMWRYVLSRIKTQSGNSEDIDIDRIVILGHGDDSFIVFPPEYDEKLRPEVIRDEFLKFGVRLQASDKTLNLKSVPLFSTRTVRGMEFLSRTLRKSRAPIGGTVYNFPLHLNNIVKSISFIDPKNFANKTELTNTYNMMCVEIAMHGPAKYEEYMRVLREYFILVGCNPQAAVSYSDAVEVRKGMVDYVW